MEDSAMRVSDVWEIGFSALQVLATWCEKQGKARLLDEELAIALEWLENFAR